jgi:hypothetical protein
MGLIDRNKEKRVIIDSNSVVFELFKYRDLRIFMKTLNLLLKNLNLIAL